MTESKESLITLPQIGRVEKTGLVVTTILTVVSYVLGSTELAFGVIAGGVLFIANFMAIRFLVNSLIANAYPKGFGIFIFIIKMLVFVGIVVTIFLFAEVNIYGFFIGVTGVVLVIIAESLRGGKDGAL
jgi:ATP synthase I subunit